MRYILLKARLSHLTSHRLCFNIKHYLNSRSFKIVTKSSGAGVRQTLINIGAVPPMSHVTMDTFYKLQ